MIPEYFGWLPPNRMACVTILGCLLVQLYQKLGIVVELRSKLVLVPLSLTRYTGPNEAGLNYIDTASIS